MTSAVRIAAQVALVSLFSYLGGFQFTSLFHGASAGMGALWSMISGILVLQATRRGTWSSAWIRVLGTLVGSIVSAVYLSWLPFSALGLAASIFVTVLLCHAARIPDHRPAGRAHGGRRHGALEPQPDLDADPQRDPALR